MNDISHSLSQHQTKLFMSTYHRISIFMRSYRFTSFIVGLNWLADTYFSSSCFRLPLLPSIAHWPQSWYVFFYRMYMYNIYTNFICSIQLYTYETEHYESALGKYYERLSLLSTSLVSGQHDVWNASIFIVLIVFFTLFTILDRMAWTTSAQNFYLHSWFYLIQTLCSDSFSRSRLPLHTIKCI